jgi:crotonobetaine/carnitine-CoA ligase
VSGATSVLEPVTWPGDKGPTWSGCPRALLTEVLQEGVRRFPDNPALIFDDGYSITSRELWNEAARFAGYLRDKVAVGERVALAIGNRAEFVIAYLAVVANRAVAVMLSPEIGTHEADYVIGDAGIKLAIVDETASSVFAAMRESDRLSRVLTVKGVEPTGFHHLWGDQPPVDLSAVQAELTDLVDIGYTSGTTGMPKALGGNHLEVLRYVDVQLRFHHHGPGQDRKLIPLQLHYGDPLVALFAAIYSGSSVILMRKFSVSRFWQVARDYQATYIVTIGSIPDMLLSRPEGPDDRNHSVEYATALAIPRDRHAELERRFGFPWREAYGSSESGPAFAMPNEFGDEFVGTGAIGIPYPDVTARLVDGTGEVLEGPATGELELSGMVVFDGYLNNPEATSEVLHDGWLRTGDIMRRDERGVYYFEGRRKELIRRSGINIAPAEIEAVLRLHPDVVDAAVVPVDDRIMGEEIKAYVELVDGAAFNPANLVAFCAARLARQKVPRYLEQRIEPFPRTETQRIPKSRLMVDGAHQTATAWDRLAEKEM